MVETAALGELYAALDELRTSFPDALVEHAGTGEPPLERSGSE
jgi:hypothetical protein